MSSHQELVQAMPSAQGNISHSLRRLEMQGLIRIGRSPDGLAEIRHAYHGGSSEGISDLNEVMIKRS